MPEVDDLSRSPTVFDQAHTLLVVVEMSQTSGLVAGMVPGLERRPLKKLYADPTALVRLIERWLTAPWLSPRLRATARCGSLLSKHSRNTSRIWRIDSLSAGISSPPFDKEDEATFG